MDKCSECGSPVSRKAEKCLECGEPKRSSSFSCLRIAMMVAMIVLALPVALWIGNGVILLWCVAFFLIAIAKG